MKKLTILLALTLISISSLCLAASLQSMSKEQVIQALEGKTMTTIPLATFHDRNSLAIYFDKNGKIIGKFNTKPAPDVQEDTGTWSVKTDGALCIKWNTWDKKDTICLSMYQLKNSIIFIMQPNNAFSSLTLNGNIKPGNQVK